MTRSCIYIAPLSSGLGLTSIVLGLARALEQTGLRIGFFKPIAQGDPNILGGRSTYFARELCRIPAISPMPLDRVTELLAQGEEDQLIEDLVGMASQLNQSIDVLLIEGHTPDARYGLSSELNARFARNFQAEAILLADAKTSPEQIDIVRQQFAQHHAPLLGWMINRVPDHHFLIDSKADDLPCFAHVPESPRWFAHRTYDIFSMIHADIIYHGESKERRVFSHIITARTLPHLVHLLTPGALVICPGDRDDVVLATALAAANGVPLAGLLLTCDARPNPEIMALCEQTFIRKNLPVAMTKMNSWDTSQQLSHINSKVPHDDLEGMEYIIGSIAECIDLPLLQEYIDSPKEKHLPPAAFRHALIQKARVLNRRIVLPEGTEPRTIRAAVICHEKNIARCILLGHPQEIHRVAQAQGIQIPENLECINPSDIRARYINPMVQLRHHKGLTSTMAEQQLEDNVVLGTMMLAEGDVDGLVSGAVHTTANTVRPALQLIKTSEDARIVSSIFFMLMPDQVRVYGDCAINPDPTPEELADIAIQSADSALSFGIEPRIAMLSYSTGTSGIGNDVEKVRLATEIAKQKRPDLMIDGPMQYDAASVEDVGQQKAPHSPVAGRATVFIFPDLNTGNTTYKAVQRSAKLVSVGPMLQGLRKPVNDLSRGALVDDIVYTIAITAIQAK
jgi:phosphate acetyltransferase